MCRLAQVRASGDDILSDDYSAYVDCQLVEVDWRNPTKEPLCMDSYHSEYTMCVLTWRGDVMMRVMRMGRGASLGGLPGADWHGTLRALAFVAGVALPLTMS